MAVTDPRTRFDDLHISQTTEEVTAAEFNRRQSHETFQSGWVVIGAIFDPSDRLLLVSDGSEWFAPGGTRKAGETLSDTLHREVKEEAGVPITPVRPHTVSEYEVASPSATTGFTIVGYEARTQATTVTQDRVQSDPEIKAAQFVESLPESIYGAALLTRLLTRATPDRWNPTVSDTG